MESTYKFDANIQGILRCEVTIACGSATNSRMVLLDSGAGVCHISYPLWCLMGMNEVCFNDNPRLLNLMGIKSADEMTFNNLPLLANTTILGNSFRAKSYEFRLDKLTIGLPTLSSNAITLENITVRVIESNAHEFIVGWNVLKYLRTNYTPSPAQSIYKITLDTNGEALFQQDRANGISNNLQNRFIYLQT